MADNLLTDYVTGQKVPNVGAEANRQAIERFLVDNKGFKKHDIQVNVPIQMDIKGQAYRSHVDLVITLHGRKLMAIKCAPGSLGSREREIVSAARLLDACPIPLSLVSDGKSAILLDSASGKKVGEGMAAIPSRNELLSQFTEIVLPPLAGERREREKLIFRSYDSMNVNVIR
ncbi:MAG: type I restriction enzyme HsdR N-terminal domain-containing protein [Deltaproteobacteria bacterium]|nr:type I restriction enzyme HsdR N-terminal domain-containing protein [Deltaproteobacteria bacterium]